MKSFAIGIGLMFFVGLISFVFQDRSLFPKISGSIGLIALLVSAIFSNVLGSGDRIRANFAAEDDPDRRSRNKLWTSLFLIGLPNLIAAVIYSIFF